MTAPHRHDDAPRRDELCTTLAAANGQNARVVAIAATLTRLFDDAATEITIVGGSAAVVWDADATATKDIDLVAFADPSRLSRVLVDQLGLHQSGRFWIDDELDIYIEAPAWTLEPDGARAVVVQTAFGAVRVIRLEDLILDRAQQWAASGADDRWRQAARLLESPHLDQQLLDARAAELGEQPALHAIRMLADHERAGHTAEPSLSHTVQRLHRDGPDAIRRALDAAIKRHS